VIWYEGCLPGIAKNEAHYSVVSDGGRWRVRLIHYTEEGTRADYFCTEPHTTLVELVNSAKRELTRLRQSDEREGGRFYVDEYWRVLVPSVGGIWAVLDKKYGRALCFPLGPNRVPLCPCPSPGLMPGQTWAGPRVGIPYRLIRGDICRWCERQDGSQSFDSLAYHRGPRSAAKLAARLLEVLGGREGRVYINQCKAFFAPPVDGRPWIFLGTLGTYDWFPEGGLRPTR